MTTLSTFSDELADAIGRSTSTIVALPSGRLTLSGVYWRPDIVVTTIDVIPFLQKYATIRLKRVRMII